MQIGCRLLKPEQCPLYAREGEFFPQYTGAVEAECWIDFGSARFLRFSDALLRHWQLVNPADDREISHQPCSAVWFFGDVLFSQMQRAMADMPPNVSKWFASAEMVASSQQQLLAWSAVVGAVIEDDDAGGLPSQEEIGRVVEAASFWSGELPPQALGSPYITLWRTGDAMRFHWSDDSRYEEGTIPIWRDATGYGAVDLRDFEREVRRSWRELIDNSTDQISRVAAYARSRFGVEVEQRLLQEFQRYAMPIDEHFVPIKLDWDEIAEAYETLMSWGEAPEVEWEFNGASPEAIREEGQDDASETEKPRS